MKQIFTVILITFLTHFSNSQTINIIFPNGGEHFMNNTWSPHNITWEATDVSSFKLEYSINNGTDWILIEDNYNTGNYYSWDVPDVESANCLIRVSEAGGTVSDESDAAFNIVPQGIFIAEWNTTMGQIRAELRGDLVPMTAQNFINLAENGFYTDLIFHRVIPNFMIQDGCPYGNGTGDPGYEFDDEFTPELRHSFPGVLSMANAGPNTNGSQYFITVVPTAWLDDHHSIFGRIIDGMDVVYEISEVETDGNDKPLTDVVLTISIVESNPQFNLTYPYDGLKVEKGRKISINWQSDFVADAKIEFSSDNGASWTILEDSIPSCEESFEWTLPDLTSTECFIKITSLANSGDFTQNSIPFEIREKPAELNRFELYEGVNPPDNNSENLIMLGKNLKFRVNIQNNSGDEINDITLSLFSNDEDISVITYEIPINDIADGNNTWSDNSFEIQLPEDFPSNGQYSFSLHGEASNIDNDFWIGDFNLPVLKKFPFMTIDDDNVPDSEGNGNTILEPGETIELIPKINNNSDEILYDVYGKLTSNAYFINIWNNVNGIDGIVYDTAAYNNGQINSHTSAQSPLHDFVFDYNANDIYQTDFNLKIFGFLYEEEGTSWDNGGILVKWKIPITLNNSYPVAEINEIDDNKDFFKIIQNPVSNFINIIYDFSETENKNSEIELIDVQGKIVLKETLNSTQGTYKINVSGIMKGIYFVKINNLLKKVVIL